METDIVAFSGGSGAGKTTLLLTLDGMQCPNGKTVTVMSSLCTRELREEAEPFRRYISRADFMNRNQNGEFVQQICYGDQHYALCKADIDNALLKGEQVAVDVMTEGIRQLKKRHSVRAVYLYARPKVLLCRLAARNKPEELRFRLEHSAVALKEALECGLYSLFLDNSEDFSRTLDRTMDFLSGKPTFSDQVSFDRYMEELREVMAFLDENGGVFYG